MPQPHALSALALACAAFATEAAAYGGPIGAFVLVSFLGAGLAAQVGTRKLLQARCRPERGTRA